MVEEPDTTIPNTLKHKNAVHLPAHKGDESESDLERAKNSVIGDSHSFIIKKRSSIDYSDQKGRTTKSQQNVDSFNSGYASKYE